MLGVCPRGARVCVCARVSTGSSGGGGGTIGFKSAATSSTVIF